LWCKIFLGKAVHSLPHLSRNSSINDSKTAPAQRLRNGNGFLEKGKGTNIGHKRDKPRLQF